MFVSVPVLFSYHTYRPYCTNHIFLFCGRHFFYVQEVRALNCSHKKDRRFVHRSSSFFSRSTFFCCWTTEEQKTVWCILPLPGSTGLLLCLSRLVQNSACGQKTLFSLEFNFGFEMMIPRIFKYPRIRTPQKLPPTGRTTTHHAAAAASSSSTNKQHKTSSRRRSSIRTEIT